MSAIHLQSRPVQGDTRESQVASRTPSTSSWQHRGVSKAGQRLIGARSLMAGLAAAIAAKARTKNCMLVEVVLMVEKVVLVPVSNFALRIEVNVWK